MNFVGLGLTMSDKWHLKQQETFGPTDLTSTYSVRTWSFREVVGGKRGGKRVPDHLPGCSPSNLQRNGAKTFFYQNGAQGFSQNDKNTQRRIAEFYEMFPPNSVARCFCLGNLSPLVVYAKV
ncbi:hypothetical protein TNCV_4638461 [Trichonephila clavipes]|uniref:Uncharacterized protein n=1 Tax=Trichonephila clavipes TaxID=2585209 RepID=A0A8X6WDF8_TRICX|nr:hypothetical protein TNCV_4638461 [Trichonephila clavipes]